MSDLPPNHHADYPQFGGLFGYVAGMTMILGRGGDGKLVADLAGVDADDHVLDIGCGPGTAARIACWSLMSVHHWPQLEHGLSEVKRVLRPGGTLIALEKRTQPGATGNASHGWTAQQAETFAAMLTDHGFTSADVADHDLGRRKVVTVTGRQ